MFSDFQSSQAAFNLCSPNFCIFCSKYWIPKRSFWHILIQNFIQRPQVETYARVFSGKGSGREWEPHRGIATLRAIFWLFWWEYFPLIHDSFYTPRGGWGHLHQPWVNIENENRKGQKIHGQNCDSKQNPKVTSYLPTTYSDYYQIPFRRRLLRLGLGKLYIYQRLLPWVEDMMTWSSWFRDGVLYLTYSR